MVLTVHLVGQAVQDISVRAFDGWSVTVLLVLFAFFRFVALGPAL